MQVTNRISMKLSFNNEPIFDKCPLWFYIVFLHNSQECIWLSLSSSSEKNKYICAFIMRSWLWCGHTQSSRYNWTHFPETFLIRYIGWQSLVSREAKSSFCFAMNTVFWFLSSPTCYLQRYNDHFRQRSWAYILDKYSLKTI